VVDAVGQVVSGGMQAVSMINSIAVSVKELTGGDLGTLIKLWIDYKIAVIGVNVASSLWTAANAALSTSLTGVAAAGTASLASMAAMAGPLVVVGVAVAALTGQLDPLIMKFNGMQEQFDNIKRASDAVRDILKDQDKGREQSVRDRERQFTETIERTSRQSGLVFAELVQRSNQLVDAQRTIVGTTTENLRVALRGVADEMRDTISRITSEISKARSAIEQSIRRGLQFADRDASDAFRRTFDALSRRPEFVTPIDTSSNQGYQQYMQEQLRFQLESQQFMMQKQLIQQRINTLTQEANTLVATGDQDSMQSARRKFEEIRRLTEQTFGLQTDMNRRTAEHGILSGTANADPNGVLRYVVPVQQLNRELQQLTQREQEAEAAFRSRQEARTRSLEEERASERMRQQQLNDSIRQLESLSATDSRGRLRQQFQGPQGLENFNREFAERRARLQEALESGNFSPEARLQASIALTQQYGAMRAQIEREAAGIAIREEQNLFNTRMENLRRLRQETVQREGEFTTSRSQFLNSIGTDVTAMQEQVNSAVRLITGMNALNPLLDTQTLGNIQRGQRRFGETVPELNAAREAASRAIGTDQEAAAFQRLQDAITATDRAYRNLFGQAGANRLNGSQTTGTDVQNTPTIMLQNADALRRMREEFQNTQGQLRESETRLGGLGNEVQRAAQQLGIAQQGLNGLGQQAGEQAPAINGLTESVRRLADQLDRLRNAPAIPGPAGGVAFEDQGFADGGLIGGRLGSFGPDDTLAAVRTGEYVMNPESTRAFLPQLVAMNAGQMPSFAKGGMVGGSSVTNVGDIAINVHDSGDPSATARAVLGAFRREIRRGNGRI
jgi:hypothetical protein